MAGAEPIQNRSQELLADPPSSSTSCTAFLRLAYNAPLNNIFNHLVNCIFLFFIVFIYLTELDSERDRKVFLPLLHPQMAATAVAVWIWSQEPGASSLSPRSPMWVQGSVHLGHPPLPSWATEESWTGRGATGTIPSTHTGCQHCRWRVNQVSHQLLF